MSSCEHIEQKLKSSSDLGDLTHLVRHRFYKISERGRGVCSVDPEKM